MPTSAGLYYTSFEGGASERPTLVLIHGAGGNYLNWPVDIRRLNGWRVLAVDLPGHGRSAGTTCQSIAAYTQRMVEFLTSLDLYQTMLIGHSMGGAITLNLAIQHPELVNGLGLIATGAYLGVPQRLVEDLSGPTGRITLVEHFEKNAFSPQTSPALIDRTLRALQDERQSVIYGDWQASANFDLREQVGKIRAPTWVVTGLDDRLTPVSYAHFLADRIPSTRLLLVPAAGHMILAEQPAALAAGLRDFLFETFLVTRG